MFGVSSRAVLKSALTEPELEMSSGLLKQERRNEKKNILWINIRSHKGVLSFGKHIYTNMFQSES